MMPDHIQTLEDAWNDFTIGMPPDVSKRQTILMKTAFFVGASAVFGMALRARDTSGTSKEAAAKMTALFEELDFFMQALEHTVHGDGTIGNA